MTIKQIDQIIEEGYAFKVLAETFGEIALLKIKKIRAGVERNRIFFTEIVNVYKKVKKEATKRQIKLDKPKDTASILLSSNYRFYGALTNKLLEYFIDSTAKFKTDRIIIGKSATDQLKFAHYDAAYSPILLKADMPTSAELLSLMESVKQYKKIFVFYPELKSLLVQNPTYIDITQSESAAELANQKEDEDHKGFFDNGRDFLFEPEIKKMLEFFDSQLTTLLLEQVFLEAELARTASRLISMDQAQVDADDYIKQKKKIRGQIIKSENNNKTLDQLASLAALKRARYIK